MPIHLLHLAPLLGHHKSMRTQIGPGMEAYCMVLGADHSLTPCKCEQVRTGARTPNKVRGGQGGISIGTGEQRSSLRHQSSVLDNRLGACHDTQRLRLGTEVIQYGYPLQVLIRLP